LEKFNGKTCEARCPLGHKNVFSLLFEGFLHLSIDA